MNAIRQQQGLRRRIALVAIVGMLFQAVLFGWHHHPLPLSSHAPAQVAALAGAAPLSPLDDEDDCDICAALHHLTAAPATFAALPAPPPVAVAVMAPDRAPAPAQYSRAFQARAPPRGLRTSVAS